MEDAKVPSASRVLQSATIILKFATAYSEAVTRRRNLSPTKNREAIKLVNQIHEVRQHIDALVNTVENKTAMLELLKFLDSIYQSKPNPKTATKRVLAYLKKTGVMPVTKLAGSPSWSGFVGVINWPENRARDLLKRLFEYYESEDWKVVCSSEAERPGPKRAALESVADFFGFGVSDIKRQVKQLNSQDIDYPETFWNHQRSWARFFVLRYGIDETKAHRLMAELFEGHTERFPYGHNRPRASKDKSRSRRSFSR